MLAPHLDGVAVSSLFEARLVHGLLGPAGHLHLTTPGLREEEVDEIARRCARVSMNSLGQLERYAARFAGEGQLGLRINPGRSFVADPRHDPCRPGSKLGVALPLLAERLRASPRSLAGVAGLHLHGNCESEDLGALELTVRRLLEHLGPWLGRLRWINLGGGYLLDGERDAAGFARAVAPLVAMRGPRVVIEPGTTIARPGGYLVASVLDLFDGGQGPIAVLDASVNHLPEVFVYGYQPDVFGHQADAAHRYTLAGCTCLAGDLFGVFAFRHRLAVGMRVVFADCGAYAQVKAHAFNGVALPTVYLLGAQGALAECGRFEYTDFLRLIGGAMHAVA